MSRERFAALLDEPFELSRRDNRWLALAPNLVAFAADDFAGWRRLQQEAWLLDRWRRIGGVPAPRVLREDAVRRVQVRERMHGLTGDELHREDSLSPLYSPALAANPDVRARLVDAGSAAPLSPFGERLAASYGDLAARIRRSVDTMEAETVAIGPTSRRSLDVDAAIAALDASAAASAAAKAAAHRTRDWLATLTPINAVIHADLHFHNMCAAPSGDIIGVFDLSDSGLDNAESEFLYAQSLGTQFAQIAMAAYGSPLDERAVVHAHLRTALDHVAYHGPTTPRHASVVAWATAVFELLA
ncbi:MAG TPA: phosphotransferase [Kofleriaceae bacterium]|nr:phosphotransferase [Kofleriaceae bacterium]